MRTTAISLALLVAGTALAAFAPTTEAVGTCSKYVPTMSAHCSYVVCVGHSWGPGYERCQYGVPDPIIVCVTDPCPPYAPLP